MKIWIYCQANNEKSNDHEFQENEFGKWTYMIEKGLFNEIIFWYIERIDNEKTHNSGNEFEFHIFGHEVQDRVMIRHYFKNVFKSIRWIHSSELEIN